MPALTEVQARELLASCVPLDQTWGAHSMAVSRSAGRIADALLAHGAPVDPDLARAGGLLHDIGRSATHDPAGHAWAGYELLCERDQPTLARFCVSHHNGGCTPEEAELLGLPRADYRPLSWEEKAVAIADGLTRFDRTVFLTDRINDLLDRYADQVGTTQYTLITHIEPKVRALMAEVEAVTGQPTEQLCGASRL